MVHPRFWGYALILAGVAVVIFGLSALFLPGQYEAATRISNQLAEPELVTYHGVFIPTHFEVLQSEKILGMVVDRLNLEVEWGNKYAAGKRLKRAEAMGMVRSRIKLSPVRSTNQIDIRTRSDNPTEAANLANATAEAYRDHRLDIARHLTATGIKTLEDRLIEHEQKVKTAQSETERFEKQQELIQFRDLLQKKTAALESSTNSPVNIGMTILEVATPPKSLAGPGPASGVIALCFGSFLMTAGFNLARKPI